MTSYPKIRKFSACIHLKNLRNLNEPYNIFAAGFQVVSVSEVDILWNSQIPPDLFCSFFSNIPLVLLNFDNKTL